MLAVSPVLLVVLVEFVERADQDLGDDFLTLKEQLGRLELLAETLNLLVQSLVLHCQ
ncbi:MAG TPA: hypothetical protein V6D03_04955 [Candidatus Caenarcaniphilales bacterium]